MFDKATPETWQALAALGLAALMSFLGVLVEEPQRSIKYQIVDIMVSGLFGLGVFFCLLSLGGACLFCLFDFDSDRALGRFPDYAIA